MAIVTVSSSPTPSSSPFSIVFFSKAPPSLLDKGKAMQRVDCESGWHDISNQVQFDALEDESDDDDGGNYPFDPQWRAPEFDTTNSLFDI